MKKSKDGTLILVENPLTGNESFAKALGLVAVDEVEKHAIPADCRKLPGWNDATKIVLVRDPFERFASGATRAFSSAKGELDAFPDLLALVQSSDPEETTEKSRGEALLRFMAGGGEVPDYLLPQSRWLSARFDTVLATHDIAAYFNVEGKVCCLRSNSFYRAPNAYRASALTDAARALFKEVYGKDIELFRRLRLWSSNPEEVRLLSGNCATCRTKKTNPDGSKFEPLDLSTAEESDEGEESASSRRRTRKAVDNQDADK